MCGKKIFRRKRPQMTIWRMGIACWVPKATHTHSEYVIRNAFHCSSGCTNAPQCYMFIARLVSAIYWGRQTDYYESPVTGNQLAWWWEMRSSVRPQKDGNDVLNVVIFRRPSTHLVDDSTFSGALDLVFLQENLLLLKYSPLFVRCVVGPCWV